MQSHQSLPFFGICPRILTLFTRPFLARRHAWAGHEARLEVHRDQFEQFEPFIDPYTLLIHLMIAYYSATLKLWPILFTC